MIDWTTFYVAVVGAAATLAGLLFVAIQINLETLVSDPGNRWRATARSTFTIYTLLIIIGLLFLIPAFDHFAQGESVIIASLFGIYRALRTWWPVWASSWKHHNERLLETLWHLIGPILAYAVLILNGISLYTGNSVSGTQVAIGIAFVGLFGLVLRNSWNLIFEVAYEKKQQALSGTPK